MLEVEMPLRFILSMMLSIFFSPWCSSNPWKHSKGGHVDNFQEATFEAASPLLASSCSLAEKHPAIRRLSAECWWWLSIS